MEGEESLSPLSISFGCRCHTETWDLYQSYWDLYQSYEEMGNKIYEKKRCLVIMFFKSNKWKRIVTLLMVVNLILGLNTFLLPWTASAAIGSITVMVDGKECKTFTPEELEGLQEEKYYTYGTINTWPTKGWYIGEGPTLVDLLANVEMPEGLQLDDIQLIKFKARDGLQLIFTKKELLGDTRYYFPGLRENDEYSGYILGSPERASKVPVVLALLSIDSDNPDDLEGRDKNAPHLLFGQRWITEQTNQAFVKMVGEIDLLTAIPEKWDNPIATPEPGIVSPGTKVRLSCQYNDADKVYYTIDGSDPTLESPMYNWVASRWWNNRKDELDEINKPIEINEDTIIKAITIGNGKLDSDIVTFEYRVAQTWYVDCAGSADFTSIQEAVTAAAEGDTIIVGDGTYTENVIVDKSLVIQSENGAELTTVQAAAANTDVFSVTAEDVIINGFSIFGATATGKSGIAVKGTSGSCKIINNHCNGNSEGITISSDNNTISNNTCTLGGRYGISLSNATGNFITSNSCINNTDGSGFAIYLADNARANIVSGNISDLNKQGIRVKNAFDNMIFSNIFSNNETGLEIATKSTGNLFYLNNFVGNTVVLSEGFQAVDGNSWNSPTEIEYMFNGTQYNGFLGNYWDDYSGVDADKNGIGDTPYQTILTDFDNYPLMGQWDNGTVATSETEQIQLSIDFGIPGVTMFITGDGFAPDTEGIIWFDTNGNGVPDNGEPLTNLTTDADGSIPLLTSLTVPSVDLGSYNVIVDVPDGGKNKTSAIFKVTNHGIIADTIEGNYHIGPDINITGNGFTPNTTYRLFCDRNGNWIFDDGAYKSSKTTADGTLSVARLSWPSAPTGIYNFLLDLNIDDIIEAAASVCVIPGIKITTPRGNPGTNIGMNITGFEANAEGHVWFDVNGNGICDEDENRASVTTSGAGTATSPGLFVPSAAPGDYQVCTDLPALGLKTSATYSITGMVLNPSSGVAGTEITVKGYGYVINQESSPTTGKYIWFDTNGNGVWDEDEIKIDVTTDANGTLSPVSFIVPAVPAGNYNVSANVFPSGTSTVFTLEENPVTRPLYKIEPVGDDVYTIDETADGIKTMTVNASQTGLKYFSVSIEPIIGHEGTETVIFTHIRDGVQLGLSALEADFDMVSAAKAGFNVEPDDIIKVYIVDKLTNDNDQNPVILQ